MTLRFTISPRLHIDPAPRVLPRVAPAVPTHSDFGTWRAFLRLGRAPRLLSLQDAFLTQLAAWQPDLLAIYQRRFPCRRHDVEDAVADVIARWVHLVRETKALRSPRLRPSRNGLPAKRLPWLALLCGQVRQKLRPRRSRSAAQRPTFESLDEHGDVFADRRTGDVEMAELIDFVRVRAEAELSPGELALLSSRLDALSGVVPPAPPLLTAASERVLMCRIHRWLRRTLCSA